jgi:hypothetical protein
MDPNQGGNLIMDSLDPVPHPDPDLQQRMQSHADDAGRGVLSAIQDLETSGGRKTRQDTCEGTLCFIF